MLSLQNIQKDLSRHGQIARNISCIQVLLEYRYISKASDCLIHPVTFLF